MAQDCNEYGLSTGAPDPFYSKENLARLKKAIRDLDAGKGTVHEVDYGQLDAPDFSGSGR